MRRAAVLIGVEKTGGLPKLKAAREGAQLMSEWATANGFEAHLITDADGPVTAEAIKRKIRALIDVGNVEQLLVYFGGHGVNLRFSEYWLLSGAPDDPDEAVNVATSEAFRSALRYPHVVLLSDACRTAAEGIQAQSVDGSSIFPNIEPTGTEKAVDLFFATVLGSPSLEIRDPADSSKRYQAVYTEEVHAAVRGQYRDYLVEDEQTGDLVLRPRRMKKLLEAKVPLRVAAILGAATPHSQIPDARITSDDEAWLARFPALEAAAEEEPEAAAGDEPGAAESPPAMRSPSPPPPPPPPVTPSLPSVTRDALRQATSGNAVAAIDSLRKARVAGVEDVADAVTRDAQAFGPGHFESGCGFVVRGADVLEARGSGGFKAQRLSPSLVRVEPGGTGVGGAGSVLLRFTDGRSVLLPAIRDFLATLSFENGELRNVAYEPSDRSPRWQDYAHFKTEMSALRSLIASSALVGGFRLDREDAPRLTDRIRSGKSLDPSMALYAAYSYHNLGRRDLIRQMNDYFAGDLGFLFFDLALLSGEKFLLEPTSRPGRAVLPFTPLLAQGWSLLDGFGARQLVAQLPRLKHCVGHSLWTVYEPQGFEILAALLEP